VNKRLLILGGGFGLYGYLPAAINASWEVSLPSRYQKSLLERVELSDLFSKVKFIEESDFDLDLNCFEGVVFARTPVQQYEFVRQNPSYKGHYFLEKPLGPTVGLTLGLLNFLQSQESSFSVGYLFRFQEWYKEIVSRKGLRNSISIEWRFSPLKDASWKCDEDSGGGFLSYYGVHLLSLIADLDYSISDLEIESLSNLLTIRSKTSSDSIQIHISSAENPEFQVALKSENEVYRWSGASPFGAIPAPGQPDPRIPALTEYLSDPIASYNLIEWISHERKVLDLRETISRVL
jgi:hypothetical protein